MQLGFNGYYVADDSAVEDTVTFLMDLGGDGVPVENSAPADLALSAATIAENSVTGTVVGELSATDADGDALTYTLTDNAGGKFALATDENGVTRLVVNGALNYESASSYSVTAKASDGNGGETSQTFTIAVSDVDEAPTGLKLSSPITPSVTAIAVAENSVAGTVVATLSATDPEGGAVTYALADDAGGLFVVDGNQIKLAQDLGDFETAATKTFQIGVVATDAQGNASASTPFNINLADAYDSPEGTLTIDASGATGGIDFATFIATYFQGLTNGAYSFYGGTPIVGPYGAQNLNGDQIAFNYKEGGVGTADRVVLGGDGLAYDYLTYGAVYGHGISGQLDSLTFGQWVDGVTQGTVGIGEAGLLTGLSEQLKISGLDLESITGTGSVASINLVYALYDAVQKGNAATIYEALSHYAQNFTGSAGNDIFTGSQFDDTIGGGAGADLLAGGGGNDTIDGGDGTDIAYFDGVFGGPSGNYGFTGGTGGAPLIITDSRTTGGTGVDTLTNVEILKFNNLTYDFANHKANYTPTDLALDDAEVAAGAAVGTVVGSLVATDQDASDTYTYTLLDDAGGLFAIDGADIKVAGALAADDYALRVRVTDGAGNTFEKELTISATGATETPGETPAGTITIDASTATAGINFESFVRGGFVADTTGGGFPVFDNGSAFAGEEMFIGYGSDAASKYVLMHGDIEYSFATHTVAGTANTIEYGTRGSGTYDADGYFSGGNVELKITGLDLSNAVPANATEEEEIEANGPIHNFAVAHMYGAATADTQPRYDKFADSLDDYAQHFVGSAYSDIYTGTRFADTIEGGAGADLLAGGGGNDTIDGGDGTDIAYFDGAFGGPSGNYGFTGGTGGAPLVITDNRSAGGSGVDTLTNVEILKFNNLTYDFVNHKANYTPTDLALDDAEVAANAAVGTVVGALAVTDQDASDTYTYTLLDSAGGLFAVDGADIKVAAALAADSYTLRVRVLDGAGNTFEKDLTIAVTDFVPNTAPVITSNGRGASGSVSVAENGTAVTTVKATDADAGATLTYSLSGGADASKFQINASTGVLTFKSAPDYENPADAGKNNVYDVLVRATDNGGLFDEQALAVTVTNVNEAPAITSNGGGASAAISIAENKTAVTTAKATDPEKGTVTWSISGADAVLFTINAATGALTFKAAPDYETPKDSGKNNVYDVTLTAKDAGGATDTQALAVTLTNVNEAPVITSNGGGSSASVKVAENKTAVTTVTASDPEKAKVTYSISGADAALFTINASTGALAFKSAPDYEAPKDSGKNNVYDVKVTAKDAGGATDTQALAVTLTNVNEAPVITSNGGGASASISLAEGKTAVTTGKASDPEKGAVTWAISGADAALFKIDAKTGALSFKSAPDYETRKDAGKNNIYDVTVKATDGGKLVDTQAIAVKITDVNEAPLISSNGGGSSASVKVAENKTAVMTLKASDPEKKALTYSISGGADKALFAINAKTGVLSFKSAPDYEAPKDAGKNNVYDVTVRASDGKLTDTQALKVAVSDVKGKTLGGTSKADKLIGTVEADILDGKAGADTLAGGKGNDTYVVDNAKDKVAEKAGEGTDLVKSSVTHTLASNVENLSLTGSKAINGTGNTLANVIAGNGAANTLTGGSGNDILKGGAGNDKLYGGSGADTLAGGSGADTFIYKALGDSTAKSYDTIADFSAKQKDRIDLSAIDANGIGGTKNDAFVYIGTKGFSGTAGELRFTNGVLQGDVNGDRSADLAVKLTGVSSLAAGNVIL
ncbi:cadherin domain-containing protein [Xanthobacter sediminis]